MEILKIIFGTFGTILICVIPLIIASAYDINKDIDIDKAWTFKYAFLTTIVFAVYVASKLFY